MEKFKISLDCEYKNRIRMTIIRQYNDALKFVDEFAEMILQGNPHFIELKSYMHIGMSTGRLKAENMLEMNEIRSLSEKICSKLQCYSTMDESEISRIVVLQNLRRYTDRWIKEYLINA